MHISKRNLDPSKNTKERAEEGGREGGREGTNKTQKSNYKKLLFLKILHSINLHTNKLKTMTYSHKKVEKRGNK